MKHEMLLPLKKPVRNFRGVNDTAENPQVKNLVTVSL
jgi:hypothetical protein